MQAGFNMGIILKNLGFVCALGTTLPEIISNARQGNTNGMSNDLIVLGNERIPFGFTKIKTCHDMRFCDLLTAALTQIAPDIDLLHQKYTSRRLGVILGASNTAVHEAQQCIFQKLSNDNMPENFDISMLELGTPAKWLKSVVGFDGPALTISTACSSSIKAFDIARKLIDYNICDAVLCGGVDARCDFALNGFNALGALSHKITNPMSANRDGINLGECAALFIVQHGDTGIKILGIGETSDAYHPTAPDPSGHGAKQAMQNAMMDAHVTPQDIDYVNMHGTGTIANDAMESKAIYELFGQKPFCASTKPLTGHCLGAAGACSVALSWLMLQHNFIIPHIYDGQFADDCAPIKLATPGTGENTKTILCNAFAFGGSNSTIIIGK